MKNVENHTSSPSREKGLEPMDVRSDTESSTSTLLDTMEPRDKLHQMDIEKDTVETSSTPATIRSNRITLTLWMVVNTLATVGIVSWRAGKSRCGIGMQSQHETLRHSSYNPPANLHRRTQVFTNKAIFNDPSFKQCQAAFASFHFCVTGICLYILSRPIFNMFAPRALGVRTMLPLAIAMCLNIILMNLSLATSTITFYQIARILLTPAVALLNFMFYRKSLPRTAVLSLVPMCVGVGIISYYEPKPTAASKVAAVGVLSVILAIVSVLVSAVYTIWVGSYQRKYEINGFQLLYNQAPIGAVLLLYVIPWTDKFPMLENVPGNKWGMILLVRH